MSEETKEEFCGACIAIPLALTGAGLSAASTRQKGEYKRRKKIMLWSGIIITVVSIAILLYFLKKGNCKTCLKKN